MLQDHPDLITLARFAFFFVPVWWLWVQFSFYADRHESDDVSHRFIFLVVIVLCVGFAASASRAVSGDPTGFVITFAAMRGVQLLLYARARKYLPATRGLYGRYLICFGSGGALWLSSLAWDGPQRYAIWTAALAANAVGALGMLAPRRGIPLNTSHLAERFQLFVLIVLGESVVRLISAATVRPWSVPLAVVLAAAVVTLATLWWVWIRSADHAALDSPRAIAWFAAANLPIVAGIAAASAGLHIAILAADGATTIGIGPRAALYGGVSVCLLASAILPSGKMSGLARAARLATSAAAMGLVFMGAIVLPVTSCRPSPWSLLSASPSNSTLRWPALSRRYAEEAPGRIWSGRARGKQRGGEGVGEPSLVGRLGPAALDGEVAVVLGCHMQPRDVGGGPGIESPA